MSFAGDTRQELARINPEKKCCMLAEISGFIRVSGNLRLVGGGKFKLLVTTDTPAVARHFKTMMQEYFSIDIGLEVAKLSTFKRGNSYVLSVGPEERSEEILRETGILLIREGMNYISDGIYHNLIKTKCCKKAYLRGLFLGAGNITNPERDYHLEIVCATEILAEDVKKLLNSFRDIYSKKFMRKKEHVVYIKESEQIYDILALMGASNQLFKYEEVRIRKEIRNKANRINNCDQANIDKTVAAAERHIEAIKLLDAKIGLESLPEKMQETAKLRLANPSLSLVELGELMEPPLKKSGINKRLNKLTELADKYRDQ